MDDIVKSDVCLVCLTENMFGDMKSVFASQFEEKGHKISYFEGYKLCSGVEPKSEQIFQSICSECEKNLKISFDFREQCRSSYEILLERAGLADVKSEVLSDTEDNGPVDFVYSEPTEPDDEESKNYRHQVFVQMKSTGKVLVPVAQIKKEEKKPPLKERTPPEVKDPASFAVEVVLKEEQTPAAATECSSGEENDDFGGDQVDDDYDSYDDDEDVKVDARDRKSKSSKRRRQSFEDENMDIFLLEGNFACPLCELVLDNFRDFKTHRKTHLWDSGLNFIKRVCELCNKHTDKYLYHIKYEHPDHKPNSCRQCDQSFNQPNQLHRHLLTHLEGKRFACKGCNHKYSNTIQLKSHISKVKHDGNLYQCQECGLTFPVFMEFSDHFTKTHYEDTAHRKFYPCFACKNIFYRRQQALKHNCDPSYSLHVANMNDKEFRKTQGGGRPKHKRKKKKLKLEKAEGGEAGALVECERCGEKFTTEDEMVCHQHSLCEGKIRHMCKVCNVEFKKHDYLTNHIRNIHLGKSSICDTCGSTFANTRVLHAHQKSVHSKPTFECDVCGGKYRTKGLLVSHKRSHEQRQYQCYHCNKMFVNRETIDGHMVKHMKYLEAKFKCSYCDKMYLTLRKLVDHERFHKRPTFPCHLCSKVYSHQGGLRHHVEFIHNGIRYNCNVCNQSLADRRQLYEHFFLHRGFKPYQCTVCTRQEVKKDRFKKHLKQHNIKYDDKLHGYIEQDPNIFKIIDECIKTTTRRLAKEAAGELAPDEQAPRPPEPEQPNYGDRPVDSSHSGHLPPLQQMCNDYPTY